MDIEAPISQVTVFTDRAQITRRASVPLQGGAQELTVAGLPAGLDENSLRANGKGNVSVKILGVESHYRPLEKTPHPKAREAQSQFEAAQSEGALLKKRGEILDQRGQTVKTMAEHAAARYARGLAAGKTSLESAAQLLDFVQSQTQNVDEQRAALKEEQRANAEKQVMLSQRLKQLQGAQQRSDYCVTVALECDGAGGFDLEISYTVRDANWIPLYDARAHLLPPVSPEGVLEGTLELTYLAKITQETGEDWNNVALTLSTAQPSLGTLPPKLEPLYVDVDRKVHPVRGFYGMGGKAQVAPDGEDFVTDMLDTLPATFAAQAPIAALHETAKVESSGATVTFELPRRHNVPTDGESHRATIAQYEFPIRLDYQAVPRRATLAYLRATANNDSGLSLLAGQVNVFRNGAFAGAAFLEAVAPGQEFKLFLGPDEQVRAKRQLVRREVDKNLMGNVRRQNYGFVIEVENFKSHRVELTVLDQIPVSRHEQIKVKPHHPAPQPETDDLGVMTWQLNLPAAAKRELHSDFTVECPREMILVGLTD